MHQKSIQLEDVFFLRWGVCGGRLAKNKRRIEKTGNFGWLLFTISMHLLYIYIYHASIQVRGLRKDCVVLGDGLLRPWLT